MITVAITMISGDLIDIPVEDDAGAFAIIDCLQYGNSGGDYVKLKLRSGEIVYVNRDKVEYITVYKDNVEVKKWVI